MKDLKTMLYGKEFAAKMELTTTKFEEIKSNYSGDYDVENERTMTIDYGNGTRAPILSIDENVPNELKELIIREFRAIWD